MKFMIHLGDSPKSFEIAGYEPMLLSEVNEFVQETEKKRIDKIAEVNDFLESMYPVLRKIDDFYREDEKELLIKIHLFYYPAEKFSAEVHICPPEGFRFSKIKRNEAQTSWAPVDISKELSELSNKMKFYHENTSAISMDGFFIKRLDAYN